MQDQRQQQAYYAQDDYRQHHHNPNHNHNQYQYGPQDNMNADYSYPPNSNSSSGGSGNEYTQEKGLAQPLSQQPSYQGSATSSTFDEKAGGVLTGTEYAKHPLSLYDTKTTAVNDSMDDLPAPIPRHPEGRNNNNAATGRPSSNFSPGHFSRGSVALLAAAEGKIPKKEGLKMWRKDEHHGVFTRGGRGKTCLRCCGCTVIFAFILIVGIVAAFLLWVRPPNILFKGVTSPQDGSQQLTVSSDGFSLNFDLDIAVSNPNFFGASFKSISAKAYYPTNTKQAIGGGQLLNVKIPAHSHNTLYFPFNMNYTKAIDPNSQILQDIATRCGFIGDTKSNIKVNYDLTLRMKIVLFTISPTFSSSTSFACPLSQSDIQGLVGGTSLGGLLGGGS